MTLGMIDPTYSLDGSLAIECVVDLIPQFQLPGLTYIECSPPTVVKDVNAVMTP